MSKLCHIAIEVKNDLKMTYYSGAFLATEWNFVTSQSQKYGLTCKSSWVVNLANILRAAFCQFSFAPKIQTQFVSTENLPLTFPLKIITHKLLKPYNSLTRTSILFSQSISHLIVTQTIEWNSEGPMYYLLLNRNYMLMLSFRYWYHLPTVILLKGGWSILKLSEKSYLELEFCPDI
jgi:hypothetical protein